MTPPDYIAFVRATCEEIEAGTGIDWFALAIQYANETAFGSAVFGNNLGNIRCSPSSFCQYATLSDYARAAIAVWHQTAFINNKYPNGFEPYRAQAAAGGSTDAALAAIVASPWSGANYGGSLITFYTQLEDFEMTPEEHTWLHEVTIDLQMLRTALGIVPGGPDPDQVTQAYSATLKQIDADVKAIPAAAGGLTAAQAQLLQEAHDAVARLEAALKSA